MKPTIVYIDDEPRNLMVFEVSLGDDWEIHCFENPTEALGKLKELNPWVILSDQKMPNMSGLELLEKATELCPDAVRIVVTGQTEERTIIELIRRAKVYDYVMKPWDTVDLMTRLGKAADYYRVRQERNQAFQDLELKNQQMEVQNRELLHLTSELKKSQQLEIELRREVESLVPTPLVKAIQTGNANFPLRRDLVCIVYDVINSSAIHGKMVNHESLRAHILRLFTVALVKNGGVREYHGGDSAFGHFAAFAPVENAELAALTTAREFRDSLRVLCRLHEVDVACGIALHIAPDALIALHEVRVATTGGEAVLKSYDSSSPQIDVVHRFEKLTHQLSGSNIIMSEQFYTRLPNHERPVHELGDFRFKGEANPVRLYLEASDLVKEQEIEELKGKTDAPKSAA